MIRVDISLETKTKTVPLYVAIISGAQFASLRGSDVLANFLRRVDALLLD